MSERAIGHYERKQFGCKSRVIAWSHQSRFKMALKLVGSDFERSLLDYGCGDGIFCERVAPLFRETVGADIAADQLQDCQQRLAHVAKLKFHHVSELRELYPAGHFDVVTCMETLEHCLEEVADKVLADLHWLCRPQGKVVISVPIETGLAFVAKWFFRKVAAWRGDTEYGFYETYPFRDAMRMIFAGVNTRFARPAYGSPESPYHSHYGFNWKLLRAKVSKHFEIERVVFTPIPLVRSLLNSQVWFVCRKGG